MPKGHGPSRSFQFIRSFPTVIRSIRTKQSVSPLSNNRGTIRWLKHNEQKQSKGVAFHREAHVKATEEYLSRGKLREEISISKSFSISPTIYIYSKSRNIMQTRSAENTVGSWEVIDAAHPASIVPSASEEFVHSQLVSCGTAETSFYTANEDLEDGEIRSAVLPESNHSFSSLFSGPFPSVGSSDSRRTFSGYFLSETPRATIPIINHHYDPLASTPGRGSTLGTPRPLRRRVASPTPKQKLLGSPRSSLGSRRPLERSPAKTWTETIPEGQASFASTSNNAHSTNQREGHSMVDLTESMIFPEIRILRWQRQQVKAALDNTDREDVDMELDATLIHSILLQHDPWALLSPEPREVTPKPPALGPHGTELIED